jgi:argininosuccinate lyase
MSVTWAGRFTQEADPLFRQFNDSLPFDRTLLREDVEGSIAWARALERASVLSSDEVKSLTAALHEVLDHGLAHPAQLERAADEDIHSWVERELVTRVGALGKKLHTGRSRNDQVATDLRLWTLRHLSLRQ